MFEEDSLNEYAETLCTALHCVRELELAPVASSAVDVWRPLASRLLLDASTVLALLGDLYTRESGGWSDHLLWFPLGGPCFDRDTFQGVVALWRAAAAVTRLAHAHGVPLEDSTAQVAAGCAVLLKGRSTGAPA